MASLNREQLQRLEDKYVNRTMRCVPEKFIELCHMHLAFLLDLSDDKLEMLLCAENEPRKRKSGFGAAGIFKKKVTEKSQTDLFGASLTEEGVSLMIPLINFLKQENNICNEGLFRKSGNKNRINALRELLVTQPAAASIDSQLYTPYDVSCVLKEFLRELPEPLVTEQHMEAHRQVLALGLHAATTKEVTCYTQKKLSALQLLMLLLPPPARKLTMHLVRLLQQIANCPQTKMTPTTLGTIFAPIFFIDRKVEAAELLNQVSQMAPAVTFMIENADELFHAPKELIVDLASYWNCISQSSSCAEDDSGTDHIMSGRTLNTNVCYIDRELSRCEDVIGNTQAELANLFAHVQSLPDTPRNAKLKKHILKSTTTPVSSAKINSQCRSISASIKKRLPSLGKSKSKQNEIQSSGKDTKTSQGYGVMSYSCTEKVAVVHCAQVDHKHLQPLRKRLDFYSLHRPSETPCLSELLESPARQSEQRNLQKSTKRRHNCPYNSENSDPADTQDCTPPKQECRATESPDPITSSNISQDYKPITSSNISQDYKPITSSNISQDSYRPKAKGQGNENHNTKQRALAPKLQNHVRAISATPVSKMGHANPLSERNTCSHLENEITYLPNNMAAVKKIAKSPRNKNGEHIARVHHRPCEAPWTPVMQRAALELAHSSTLETSI